MSADPVASSSTPVPVSTRPPVDPAKKEALKLYRQVGPSLLSDQLQRWYLDSPGAVGTIRARSVSEA